MEVAIAGGHGQIAMHLARKLIDQGDGVRSLIRNPDHADDVRETGAEPVLCDLEGSGEEAIAEALGDADAVVFAAGAGPGSGPDRKWTVDYEGAVKLAGAAKRAGIERYLVISSMGADPDHGGEDDFDVYLRAKGKADAEVAQSGLQYTIVRPGMLTDDPPSGRVAVGESVGRSGISREDVAAVLAAALRSPETIDRAFEVVEGEVPVEQALGAA